jgi:uncharacterized membrane protein YiaA
MGQFKHFMCQTGWQRPQAGQLLQYSTLCAVRIWRAKRQISKRPYYMHALILCEAYGAIRGQQRYIETSRIESR